jgi:hypothetical protein
MTKDNELESKPEPEPEPEPKQRQKLSWADIMDDQ